jgi:hypothetical protein
MNAEEDLFAVGMLFVEETRVMGGAGVVMSEEEGCELIVEGFRGPRETVERLMKLPDGGVAFTVGRRDARGKLDVDRLIDVGGEKGASDIEPAEKVDG